MVYHKIRPCARFSSAEGSHSALADLKACFQGEECENLRVANTLSVRAPKRCSCFLVYHKIRPCAKFSSAEGSHSALADLKACFQGEECENLRVANTLSVRTPLGCSCFLVYYKIRQNIVAFSTKSVLCDGINPIALGEIPLSRGERTDLISSEVYAEDFILQRRISLNITMIQIHRSESKKGLLPQSL